MFTEELRRQDLFLVYEVPQIRSAERATARAVTRLVQGPQVGGVSGVAKVHTASVPHQRRARASQPSGKHTIEHVHSSGYHVKDTPGIANAHEVP